MTFPSSIKATGLPWKNAAASSTAKLCYAFSLVILDSHWIIVILKIQFIFSETAVLVICRNKSTWSVRKDAIDLCILGIWTLFSFYTCYSHSEIRSVYSSINREVPSQEFVSRPIYWDAPFWQSSCVVPKMHFPLTSSVFDPQLLGANNSSVIVSNTIITITCNKYGKKFNTLLQKDNPYY